LTLRKYSRDLKPVIVNFGLTGEPRYIYDFIESENPLVIRVAARITVRERDKIIEEATKFVTNKIRFPHDWQGKAATERHIKIFRVYSEKYRFDKHFNYGWLKPSETLTIKYGICIDTSLLLASILIFKKINCFVTLGAILNQKKNKFIGLHAWVETTYKNKKHIIETTAPSKPLPIISHETATTGFNGIIYDGFVWFNQTVYIEDSKKAMHYEKIISQSQGEDYEAN